MSQSYQAYIERNATLKEMGFDSYQQYLASPLWSSIRIRAFKEHGNDCIRCGQKAVLLHHTSYSPDVLSGDSTEELIPLCDRCHERAEFALDGSKRSLSNANAYLRYSRRKNRKSKPPLCTRNPKPAPSRGKVSNTGDPCPQCGTPVVKKAPKQKYRKGQKYAFQWYLACHKCHKMYMVDSAKYLLAESILDNRINHPDPNVSYCSCGNAKKAKNTLCGVCQRKLKTQKPS
jgi:hypothetical protein